MYKRQKYYRYNYWFGNNNWYYYQIGNNNPIHDYQQIMRKWYVDQLLPELNNASLVDGFKCYLGSHDCKNFMLFREQFPDMIGFDLYNPTKNPWVIQLDFNKVNVIKIPVSLAIPVIGSRVRTPLLQKKVYQWLDKNLLVGGIAVCSKQWKDQLTNVKTVKEIYNPFRKENFHMIVKVDG